MMMAIWGGLLVLLGAASAEEPTAEAAEETLVVESIPSPERDEAVLLHAELTRALGEGARLQPRLVRRFYQGEGWQYLVVIEQVPDAAAAARIVDMADGLRVIQPIASGGPPVEPTRLLPQPTTTTATTAATVTTAATATAAEVGEPRGERLPTAESVLRVAVKAHGGRAGAEHVKAAQSLRFTYQRLVPDAAKGELVAENEFLRLGDALRLTVRIQAGQGTDSVTTLTADRKGWVEVGRDTLERDGGRTLEVLQRFSPESVLAIPLGLPEDVETAAAWRGLQTQGREGELWVLVGTLAPGEIGLREAAFDATGRLSRVIWAAEKGDMTFQYGDYRVVAEGVVAPFRVRIEQDGELIEEIQVSELSLEPPLEVALFQGPRPR